MSKTVTRTSFLTGMLALILAGSAFAQQKTVEGAVTATDAETLIGVTVMLSGTSSGTVTDYNGHYSIEASPYDTLVFSYTGFEMYRVPVGDQNVIDVVMTTDKKLLEEIVVVGYGTMKKSDVAGAIVSMRDEALTDVKSGNVLESLQGRVAGVEISRDNGRAGSGIDILMRGRRSLAATNSPLILVDGVPYGEDIDLDQSDIESIEFLKDAASTAIYGSRGANGVILVTTKRGVTDHSRIIFNAYYGISDPYQRVPVYDRDGYIQAKIDANKDINNWDIEPNPFNVFPGDELTGYENGTYTDWQDLVTQTGNQQSYLLGFEGGSKKFTYSTTLNYFNELGVSEADKFKRITAKINLDGQVHKRINVGTSTIISFKNHDGRGPRFTDAVLMSPIVPAYDSLGNYLYQPNFANPRKSPLAQLLDVEQDRNTRVFSTLYAGVDILEGLSFRTNFNIDLSNQRLGYMYPQKAPNEGFTTSGVENDYFLGYLWNNILSYHRSFGKHSLYATLVHEVQYDRRETYNLDGQQQQFDRTLWYNLSTNQSQTTNSALIESALVSFLGRINYTFNDRYIFSLSGRYDGASQLTEGNKWEFFPAASFAWRVIEEDFMKDQNTISDLKLRLSYGVTGNAAIAPYSTAASLNLNPYYYQFGEPGAEHPAFSYRPEALASIDLKWERTAQTNFGVDFGFFKNRISGSFDFFTAKTDRLLLPDQLPPTTGFDNIFTNAGKTKTNGIEVYLHTVNVDSRQFKWYSDITFYTAKEEIVELASGLTEDEGNGWFVGYPIDVFYDFRKLGIWQFGQEDEPTFTAPGEIRVEDVDGNGVIDFDDRVILGSSQPDWSGSLVNTFVIFGFDLSVNIYAKMGHLLDAGAYDYDPRMYDNMAAVDYWTPVNPTNNYPRYDVARAELPFESTLSYVKGSYVKIKNITLGYTFPKKQNSKSPFSDFRVYASAKNPFILYSNLFDGLDPERGGSINWPLARTWLVGVNTSF